jgi:hypothetical protein
MLQTVAPLIDDAGVIVYDRDMFIIQATAVIHTKLYTTNISSIVKQPQVK